MLRSVTCTLFILSSFGILSGQPPIAKSDQEANKPKTAPLQPTRDVPLPGGVNLVFLIKELAKDLNLNVLFDSDSRLEMRTVRIEVKNVSTAEALDYILLQENLIAERVDPRTILIANRVKAMGVPELGVNLTPLNDQLSQFFAVAGGSLINYVRADSPAAAAGLRAGDVITAADDAPVRGALALREAVKNRSGTEIALKIVRDRKSQTVTVVPRKGIE